MLKYIMNDVVRSGTV